MPPHGLKPRTRFFLAVEGESEQSFAKWIQDLAGAELSIHLDVHVLGGGGFTSMLEKAKYTHAKKAAAHGPYKKRILLLDSDRADRADNPDWPEEKLRKAVSASGFILCLQRPNHEGILLRLNPGAETRRCADAASAEKLLKQHWPGYKKPTDARELRGRFTRDDLIRAGRHDPDLGALLAAIGFTV